MEARLHSRTRPRRQTSRSCKGRLPVAGIDYCFCKREERNTTLLILGAVDNVYLTGTAIWADAKGPRDADVVQALAVFCR